MGLTSVHLKVRPLGFIPLDANEICALFFSAVFLKNIKEARLIAGNEIAN